VIVNGSLGMSGGKIAAQAFHCGWRIAELPTHTYEENEFLELEDALYEWENQGRRVVVRVAKTQAIFDRVMEETKGVAQQDEGLTEVERGSITAWVTIPYKRSEVPKILSNNKVQLYRG